MNKITNCCFDLYGTLVDIHTNEWKREVFEAMYHQLKDWNASMNLSVEDLRNCYTWGFDQVKEEAGDLEMDIEPVFAFIISQCNLIPNRQRIEKLAKVFRLASIDKCQLYPGAKEFLNSLKENGIMIYLISNAQKVYTMPELEKLGITDLFDGICISSNLGYKKPDSRIFQTVIDHYHLCVESTVMIGNDGVCDINGAKSVGLHTIYFHTESSPKFGCRNADLILYGPDYKKAYKWIVEGK